MPSVVVSVVLSVAISVVLRGSHFAHECVYECGAECGAECACRVCAELGAACGVGVVQVEMAISRTKKEETVGKAKKELENCYLIASINYKAFTVRH